MDTKKTIIYVTLTIGSILMIAPFIWMILTSFKSFGESTAIPPIILPNELKWANYTRVFSELPFLTYYWNTILITVSRVFVQLLTCSLAAYAFARIEFPGRNIIFVVILTVLMVPPEVYLIPQYLLVTDMGLLNTIRGIVIPGMTSVFGTFLLRQFFMTIPKDLEEAAKIDGCNHFRIYYRILIPLTMPGLIALSIFVTQWSWNELLWPLIIVNSPDKLPLAVGLATLQGQYLTEYPLLMAGSLMAIAPMIILFFVLQRYFIEGITLSGVKG